MFTNNHRDATLNVLRGTTYTSFTPYAGLITVITDWRAGTVTEASYTGYGTRPSITFSAPANMSPIVGREIANSAVVTFPQNTGSNQDVIGWGIWDASTAGNLKGIGLLDTDPPLFGVGDPTSEDIYSAAHGLATDQRVFVLAAPGCVLPAGLSEGTAYYVLAAGLTTDNFRLSTTSGGAAVNITARGQALFIPYKAVTVSANGTPEFAANALKMAI